MEERVFHCPSLQTWWLDREGGTYGGCRNKESDLGWVVIRGECGWRSFLMGFMVGRMSGAWCGGDKVVGRRVATIWVV